MNRSLPRQTSRRPRTLATVAQYMTRSPHSIGREQTLAVAHTMMTKHGIRHLPVLAGGRLLGIVSQRDLYLVETLRDVDPRQVTVEEAMSQDVYRVAPEATLQSVARTMSQRKYGCAVVMEQERVVGMFTTVDALRALTGLLSSTSAA